MWISTRECFDEGIEAAPIPPMDGEVVQEKVTLHGVPISVGFEFMGCSPNAKVDFEFEGGRGVIRRSREEGAQRGVG